MTRFNFIYCLLFLALPFLGNSTTNWLGTISTDWFNSQNWSNGLPTAGNNAQIPNATPTGRMPIINAPLEFHFDIQNQGQIQVLANVKNYGLFRNQPGAMVRNRAEFGNFGNIENSGLFENGCTTCDTTGIGFTNYADGQFSNFSTIVVKAKFIINRCSQIVFDSPTKANLDGDIRLYGVAYLLRGDVVFAEQTGSVLFSPDDVAMPSIQTKEATVTLDATGNATITPEMVDDGSSADYCTPIVLSVSPNHFTCADLGVKLVVLTGTDGHGNQVSAETYVTILASVACFAPQFTVGGIIGGEQNFCPGDSPAPLYDSIPAVGLGGYAVEYAWETTNSDPNISLVGLTTVANANGSSYEVPTLSQSAWYRRKARLAGTTNYTAFSNWQKLTWQNPAPTAICQNIIVVKPTGGSAVITAQQIDNGSVAGCVGIGSYSLNQSTFSSVGIYNVLLLVANLNGDISMCSAIVDVRNPPVTSSLTPPPHSDVPVTATSATATGAIVNFSLTGGSTNCALGGLIYTQTEGLPSGSFFPIGETQICYTASDPCGSIQTCCFVVRVTRPAAPTFCDSEVNGAISVTLDRITTNANGTKTYQFKVCSEASNAVSNVAFQLPPTAKAVVNAAAGTPSLTNYTGTSGITYKIENGTNKPFYCIKFNTIGEGIKNGQCETFLYTLPAAIPILANIKVSVKYANTTNTITIQPQTCDGSNNNLKAPAYALKMDAYKKGFDVSVNFQSKIGKRVIEYRIERSADDTNFETIGTEIGGGYDGEISYLNFLDEKPLPGANFYRISAVLDLGIDWTTDSKKVEMPTFGDFSVFPNPASEETWIDLTEFAGKAVKIQFANSTGKIVRTIDFENAPEEPVLVQVGEMSTGFYTLHITSENFTQDKTFVVIRK